MPDVLVTIDGRQVEARAGTTILDACRRLAIDTPTLCQLDNLTPVNVCRVCVVELDGSRVLVPACSRKPSSSTTHTRHTFTGVRLVELDGSRVLVPACSRKVEEGMKIQ